MIPSRRAFLLGSAGACLALPLLESLVPRVARGSEESERRRRLVLVGGAISLGQEVSPGGTPLRGWTPQAPGPLSALPFGAESLAPVRDEVSMLFNGAIPSEGADGVMPAGGRHFNTEAFHFHMSPLLTGHKMTGSIRAAQVVAPSADQVVADALSGLTPFRILTLSTQRAPYVGEKQSIQRFMSFRELAGQVSPVSPSVSPQDVYLELTGAMDSRDPSVRARRLQLLRERRSVLDLVDRRRQQLAARLSGEDRRRVEQHYDHLRDLEGMLSGGLAAVDGTCDEGTLPEQGLSEDFTAVTRQHIELIRMSLACDLTRVATLLLSWWSSEAPLRLLGMSSHSQLHHAVHFGSAEEFEFILEWHAARFADLVKALRETSTPSGTLLDDTALCFIGEGGFGRDPNPTLGVDPNQIPYTSHTTDAMCMLVAGCPDRLRLGEAIALEEGANHPAQVLLAVMEAAGVRRDRLGEMVGAARVALR